MCALFVLVFILLKDCTQFATPDWLSISNYKPLNKQNLRHATKLFKKKKIVKKIKKKPRATTIET